MSVQYDGSIRINAKIDTDGVEKDIESISDKLDQLEKGANKNITIRPIVDSTHAEGKLTEVADQSSFLWLFNPLHQRKHLSLELTILKMR